MAHRNDATPDRSSKIDRIRGILSDLGAPAVHLTTAASLAWLLDGPRTAVPLGGAPVFSATVTADGSVTITALANEIERLRDEELAGELLWREIPWYGDLASPPGDAVAEADVSARLRAARADLLPSEIERYRALGADTARAMSAALKAAEPGWTERQLAGYLAESAYGIGAEPAVLLVAGASRGSVQHPIPTDAPLGDRAMAVITTVRDGLHVSATRWVTFADHERFADTEARLREVEADILDATVPGSSFGAVFDELRAAYARHGFGDDAWTRHHQGGPTGYLGRDPKVTPGFDDTIGAHHAVAWNPWVPGAKLEDTVLVTADGVEVLSLDPEWPSTTVRGRIRPLPLART